MDSHVFMVEKPCPVCGQKSRELKTRSRIMVEKTDEDFCVHYKGFNPYFYKIWICEHCGFAADENTFLSKLPVKIQAALKEYLAANKPDIEFVEDRDSDYAIKTFELALKQLDAYEAPASKRGSLNLQLAWLYRFAGNEEVEKEYLQKAAEYYATSIVKERYPIGNMTDTAAMYLVGALYFRLSDYEKCAQYFSRIIGDQNIRSREPKIFDKTRDLWEEVRAIQKAQQKKK